MRYFLFFILLIPMVLAGCGNGLGIGDDDDDTGDDDDSSDDDDDSSDDDDDSAEPAEFGLTGIQVSCSDEARALTASWDITIDVTGWLTSPLLFIWDQVPYEGYHYIDPWQPFADWENVEYGDNGAYDVWSVDILGFNSIAEAEKDGDTIFRCVDSNGVSQIEEFNFMVCADDVFGGTSWCWFSGNEFGAMAGTAANPVGTVGGFDDGTYSWAADVSWTPGEVGNPYFFFIE